MKLKGQFRKLSFRAMIKGWQDAVKNINLLETKQTTLKGQSSEILIPFFDIYG
jgi:hypothetical protein